MVYRNLTLRLISSLLFLLTYLIIYFLNFDYVFYLIFIIYILIFLEILIYFQKYKFVPIIYSLISFIFFFNIEFNEQINLTFNLFIICVITFDTFAYLIGKSFGKTQLIKISPNKTIEGFLGGVLFSFSLSIIYLFLSNININIKLCLFIVIIILSSFIGDLIQSYFKRKNLLKNSSEFVPGHGGIFDRFDSFLFSIISYSLMLKVLI